MPLQIIRNDITKVECDAIVNAANSSLLGGGGVDGAIHRAAGVGLLEECKGLGGCATGEAKITKGYELPAKYVIHTVGPIYDDGEHGEEELLHSCYINSLKLAVEHNCESVAFPLISAGAYGYPKAKALRVAVDSITEFLIDHDMMVYIVVFDKSSFQISEKLFNDIASFIDDKYVDKNFIFDRSRNLRYDDALCEVLEKRDADDTFIGATYILNECTSLDLAPQACQAPCEKTDRKIQPMSGEMADKKTQPKLAMPTAKKKESASLNDALNSIDESFSQMLLRKIDEKGLADSAVYKKANIDRKLFSKIRSNIQYKPSKTTAIAFAIALELSLEETKDMLMKAGFALSHSNKFDIIIEYFITKGNYNVFEINEALFAFDQALLGC